MRDCWYKIDDNGCVGTYPDRRDSCLKPEYGSSNDLWDKGKTMETGSCQWSSAIWCYYALNGNPGADPRKLHGSALQKLVATKPTNPGLGSAFSESPTAFRALVEIARGLRMSAEGISSVKLSPKDHNDDLIEQISKEKGAYLVWMKTHMVAFYTESQLRSVHFFDNNMGCVKCTTTPSLKKLAQWACRANGEAEAKWTCVRCTLSPRGRRSAFEIKRDVEALVSS